MLSGYVSPGRRVQKIPSCEDRIGTAIPSPPIARPNVPLTRLPLRCMRRLCPRSTGKPSCSKVCVPSPARQRRRLAILNARDQPSCETSLLDRCCALRDCNTEVPQPEPEPLIASAARARRPARWRWGDCDNLPPQRLPKRRPPRRWPHCGHLQHTRAPRRTRSRPA